MVYKDDDKIEVDEKLYEAYREAEVVMLMLADGVKAMYENLRVGENSVPDDLAEKCVLIWLDSMVNNNG